jgi:periplasmic protein TonB
MRIKVTQKPGFFCIIAAFCICGLAACNSGGDTKTAENGMSSDSNKTAGTADSAVKDTAAIAAKPAKRRKKASIVMPATGTDKIVKDKDGIYNRAEIMPEYPGGQNALSAYINDNIDYSQNGIAEDTTSRIRISFVVGEKGKVMDVHLIGEQKPASSLDNQAIKAISNMPAWTPGKVKGKDVKTRLELPIAFEPES